MGNLWHRADRSWAPSLLLQLGAVVVQATGREAPAGFRSGREAVRVLCVGDSNPYGVSVQRDETCPAQL